MQTDHTWSHAAEFAAEPTSAGAARTWVRQRLLERDLPDLVEDLQLVVSELATNAMLHARTPFLVTLSGRETSVRLEVQDGAQGGPVQFAAQTDEPNGRGLAIVDALTRAWGITGHLAGGKSVWAEFDRRA